MMSSHGSALTSLTDRSLSRRHSSRSITTREFDQKSLGGSRNGLSVGKRAPESSSERLPSMRANDPLDLTHRRGTLVWEHEQGISPWDTFKLVQTLTSNYNTVVNVVTKKRGGALYVMKSLQQQQLNQPNSTMKEMQNEQDKLKLVDHPNIVKVCTCDHDSLLVLMAGVVHVLCSL
jgi:hypothetical protein